MQWFSNLKTRTKILTSFLVMCSMMIAVGGYGIYQLHALNESVLDIGQNCLPGVNFTSDLATNTADFRVKEFRHVATLEAAGMTAVEQALQKILDQVKFNQEGYQPLINTDEERRLFDQYKSDWTEYLEEHQKIRALSRANKTEEAGVALRGKSFELFNTMTEALNKLGEISETASKEAQEKAAANYQTARFLLMGVLGASVVVAVIMAFVIGGMIARPLVRTVSLLETVAQGDFTQTLDIESHDEVGQMAQALNAAIASVRNTLQEVQQVSGSVAGASQQLSAASQEISSGAQEQASNLEETASSLEEITSTIKQNSDNAQQANQLAVGAREVAEKGGQVVASAIDGMTEINRSSKKIAEIITAIDEIAFQTNLLALNAAVEAARAGEQGRGFAVVAGEVRNLAQRSAAAAKEIKELIQDSVRKVETGSELVNKSGQTLQEIVTSVKRVTDIVSEIAAASREQSSGIDQVSRAVAQMDQVTQANASQTEELSGTAESLSGQASLLQEVVSRFKLSDDARPVTRSTPAPVAKVAPTAPARKSPKATNGKATNGKHTNGKAATNGHATHELDLIGAGAGSNRLNGHFDEF